MTICYFSPILKTLIGIQIARRHGQDAWLHVMRCLNAHELSDMEVEDFGEFALRPYCIQQAVILAEVGKNIGRLRP